MLQLIYASFAQETWDQDMRSLCEQAQCNNERDEITGILLHHDGRFLQALEGPKATVEDCFLRIIVDRRHHRLNLLVRRALTRREFGDWSMKGLEASGEKEDAVKKVATIVAAGGIAGRAAFHRHFEGSLANHLMPDAMRASNGEREHGTRKSSYG